MLGSEIIDGWIFNFFFFYLFSIRQLIQALAERVITIFQLTEVKERIIIELEDITLSWNSLHLNL